MDDYEKAHAQFMWLLDEEYAELESRETLDGVLASAVATMINELDYEEDDVYAALDDACQDAGYYDRGLEVVG